jgi:hypothetical protein
LSFINHEKIVAKAEVVAVAAAVTDATKSTIEIHKDPFKPSRLNGSLSFQEPTVSGMKITTNAGTSLAPFPLVFQEVL